MQKLFIPALMLMLVAFGCSKSNDDTSKTAALWIVSDYQSGSVSTSHDNPFDGYTFEFNDLHEFVIHLPDGSTETAKWAVDSDNAVAAFDMTNPHPPLDLLAGTWEVTVDAPTNLKLQRNDDVTTVQTENAILEFRQQ